MIINQFLQWVIDILGGSHINVNFDGSIPEFFLSVINLVAYVLPLDVLIQISVITFALYVLRFTIAFFRSIWSIIPVA